MKGQDGRGGVSFAGAGVRVRGAAGGWAEIDLV